MPHTIAAALAAKTLIAKSCAAALVVGAAGVAYTAIPETNTDELGSVSVDYAPEIREQYPFAVDRTPEGVVQIPVRYQPGPDKLSELDASPGANRDSWNEAENSPSTTEVKSGKESPNEAGKTEETGSEEKKPVEGTDKEGTDKDAEADTTAPALDILYPVDGSHHENKVVVFEGKTEPGAKVFAGRYQANVDSNGNWRIELVLSPGANGAEFKAIDAAGNKSYDDVTVWLDVEETEPVNKPVEDKPAEDPKSDDHEDDAPLEVEFQANQKYGYCDAENPYEILWGKATPNTVVHVTSPYGSGAAEVSKTGHWEIKLYFPEAPKNQAFTINVAAVNGSKNFSYTAKSWDEEPEVEPEEEPEVEPEEEPVNESENPGGEGEDI
jgi:hypothetical protein